MVSFLALYRGRNLSDAQLVGVSARRDLINTIADAMLADLSLEADDPVSAAVSDGRRKALEIVRQGTVTA